MTIEITLDTALQSFSNFRGYVGDRPTNEAEYNALIADSERALLEETSVFEGTAPTWAEVQTKLVELQTAEDDKLTDAANGNQKLLDLGLTQAEATALTGYKPTE